jgi:hypothetical protein
MAATIELKRLQTALRAMPGLFSAIEIHRQHCKPDVVYPHRR